MKNILTLAVFACLGFAATSVQAQSTISPVPGAVDRPHQTAPTASPSDQVTGQTRSDGQMAPAKQYNTKRTRNAKMSMTGKKEERKEMKMQKKADKAGSM